MSERFKVDFVGIGSGKCGSTWLYANLVKHPQACDRNLKELNYFSDLYDEHPLTWYESQFGGCSEGRIKGEFSVTYLAHPLAATRLKRHFPDVKILAIVRNPIQRTFSNYLHSLRKGDLSANVPFSTYIESEENLLPARYSDHFGSWYDTFDRDKILVLVLEEFIRNPEAGYRNIFSFLGVEPSFLPPGYRDKNNEARSYRFLWLENALVQTYRFLSRRGHTKLVKRLVDSGWGELVRKLNGTDQALPKIDADSRLKLIEYYRPYNRRLSELTGLDLSAWPG
jgi:hypothetical protein